MKSRIKEVLLPTAVLTLICVIVAAALAGTNLLTKEKIAEQAEKKSRRVPGAGAARSKLF